MGLRFWSALIERITRSYSLFARDRMYFLTPGEIVAARDSPGSASVSWMNPTCTISEESVSNLGYISLDKVTVVYFWTDGRQRDGEEGHQEGLNFSLATLARTGLLWSFLCQTLYLPTRVARNSEYLQL